MDRRALAGLLTAAIGLTAAVAGAVTGNPLPSLLAGAAALGSGGALFLHFAGDSRPPISELNQGKPDVVRDADVATDPEPIERRGASPEAHWPPLPKEFPAHRERRTVNSGPPVPGPGPGSFGDDALATREPALAAEGVALRGAEYAGGDVRDDPATPPSGGYAGTRSSTASSAGGNGPGSSAPPAGAGGPGSSAPAGAGGPASSAPAGAGGPGSSTPPAGALSGEPGGRSSRGHPPSRGPESVFDNDTGLLDERVFIVSLERKVAAARRHLRPLTLVLVDVTSGLPADPGEQHSALTSFGAVIRETMRDSDIACRIGSSNFALILEDTPEAGGVWAAERLQIAMACANTPLTRMVASVATYPNHGLQADEVLLRGRAALVRARNSDSDGLGPVEIAKSD